jgi:DNA-binding response OmpR family regulator
MILIVDDEPDIRESLEEFFQDEGFAVTTAGDGAAALRCLDREELPCVVILDLLMPVLDGNELYKKMQADPRLCQVPVIISTSDPGRAPSGVLTMKKPVNLTRLLAAVRQHCAAAS